MCPRRKRSLTQCSEATSLASNTASHCERWPWEGLDARLAQCSGMTLRSKYVAGMSHPADQARPADDGVARLAVLTQVTRVFGVLTVVGALLAVSQLGGIALPQS